MHTSLKQHFQKPQFDAIPNIELYRSAKTEEQLFQSLVGGSTHPSGGKAFEIAWNYLTYESRDIFEKHDYRLITMAKFYYQGIMSIYGDRPFETFILNKTYRESVNLDCSRLDFFNMVSRWEPFLKDLIIDTCNFVMTGKRDINISILYGMSIDFVQDCYSSETGVVFPELNVKQRFEWKDIECMSSQEFFNKWVNQKNGLQDLICSHKVMLGL